MKHIIIVETDTRMNPGNKDHWKAILANPNNKVHSVACCEDISRVQVIDWKNGGGLVFTHWEDDSKAWVDLQDDGRTLKVFLEQK